MQRKSNAVMLLVALSLWCAPSPSIAQVPTCPTGLSFPNAAIDRNPAIFNTAADLRVAVSANRIVLTSNDKVQVRCRGTGGKVSGTNTLPLRGATLSAGLFVTDPPVDDLPGGEARNMFDTRVIYDNYSDRFWIVSSENRAGFETFENGRLHIAVSKTATPNSWSGTQWTKCTFGTGADYAPMLLSSLGGSEFADTFPDRPSIAIDAEHLFICYREGKLGETDPFEMWSIILVIAKHSITDTCGNPPCAAPPVEAVLRVDKGMILELAVDYEIDPNAASGVYVVSRGLPTNQVYGLRVGRVSEVAGPGTWAYSATNYSLGNFAYKSSCVGANGGEYQIGDNCEDTLMDSNDNRGGDFFSCVTRPDPNGVQKIWAVHTVRSTQGNCPSPGMLQWYEIPASNPASLVATRYTLSDGDSATDASIAVNANGDLAITFSRAYADTTKYPGIWKLIKPYGGAETVSEEKPGPAIVYRPYPYGDPNKGVKGAWADYAGTEPDPVDDCQFWAHHLTVYATPDDPCGTVSQKWQSWLMRYRVNCGPGALRGNLDMDLSGELTADDIAIYQELAGEGDPEMDRTYDGETDVVDFLDFMNEWNDPG